MKKIPLDYQSESVCYTSKREKVTYKDILKKFGDIQEKHNKIAEFMKRNKTDAKVIPIEELGNHEVALFQSFAKESFQTYSLSDIMVDFQIEPETGKVTVLKLYRFRGEEWMETRTYWTGNYNKTWRAWTALPPRQSTWMIYD